VTAAVHQAGGRIFLQLWHVGRISHPSLQPGGILPVAPSAIAAKGDAITFTGLQPFPTPRALEAAEIADVVRQFGEGARQALAAGFDGVELHGANGYLIDQFLRDGTNQRGEPLWRQHREPHALPRGGDRRGRRGVGAERVGLRISPRGEFNDMRDSDPAALFGRVATIAGHKGLAYLHVVEPVGTEDPLAPRLRAAFGGPLMLNGGFDGATAEAALAAGEGDLVSFGAPFLANPDLPVRLRTGAPLNTPDRDTFYGGAAKGYTDYPALGTAAA